MDASELRAEYRQAIASPLNLSKSDIDNGQPFVLFSDDWIRILFVRRNNNSPDSLEVELSISMIGRSSKTSHKETVATLISYLNYILQLHDYGFKLEAMEDDVLWTAVKEIKPEPDMELFEILLPPIVKE